MIQRIIGGLALAAVGVLVIWKPEAVRSWIERCMKGRTLRIVGGVLTAVGMLVALGLIR